MLLSGLEWQAGRATRRGDCPDSVARAGVTTVAARMEKVAAYRLDKQSILGCCAYRSV